MAPARRKRPPINVGWKDAGMLVWNAEQSRVRLQALLVDDDRAPITALRNVIRVAKRFISMAQARAMRAGSQPVVVGLPEYP